MNEMEAARAFLERADVLIYLHRALGRDSNQQARDGLGPPRLYADTAAAIRHLAGGPVSKVGTKLETVVVRDCHWVGVAEAARVTGVSGRYIRYLAAAGDIRAYQDGGHAPWHIDLDSLKGVLANADQDRKRKAANRRTADR